MDKHVEITPEELSEPVTYPVEAFLCPDYARAEHERLWPRIWQMAGRLEDIPKPGDFFTYNIGDESIIVVRADDDTLRAFYNVCPHRGRQLVNSPDATNGTWGNAKVFVCGFHGWSFNRKGENTHVLDKDDWKGLLDDRSRTCLTELKVDTWGGYVYINMDPDCEPLREFLEPAASILDPFQLEKMRYKWRQWAIYPCNWKTAIEAFMEPYHVAGTHTQLLKYGQFYSYSKPYGKHSVSGFDERDKSQKTSQSGSVARAGLGDPRVSTYELARENYETLNHSGSTATLVNAAKRLKDELPEGTPVKEVMAHWLKSAREDDARRGVTWPEITPEQQVRAGLAWSLFPNQTILQGATFALAYRTRPYGADPNQCIFEAYALERFPEGEEPETEWVQAEPTEEHWGMVLAQDFSNMEWVQRGMKSRGFRGTLPNPHQEQKITNFHRVLASYMGTGSPRKIEY